MTWIILGPVFGNLRMVSVYFHRWLQNLSPFAFETQVVEAFNEINRFDASTVLVSNWTLPNPKFWEGPRRKPEDICTPDSQI